MLATVVPTASTVGLRHENAVGRGDAGAAGVSTGTAVGAISAAFGVGPTTSPQSDERLRDGGFIVGVRAAGDRRNVALEVLTRAGGESFDIR